MNQVNPNPASGGAGPIRRAGFPHFVSMGTRWMDNDAYGHVNNVVYYSFFDTAVNIYMLDHGVLDYAQGEVIQFVVESGCRYFAPIAFPQTVAAGLRVARLGNSSVRYEIALFVGDDDEAAAFGHFVHVCVDRRTQRPVALPAPLQAALEPLVVADQAAVGA
ncbi:MAG: thioesterase family protein [Burkholderiaceae bacterium]